MPKQLPQIPALPKTQGTESSYDRELSRQLFQMLFDIYFVLNNEVARTSETTTARDTELLLFDVDNNTIERVTVGVADSGGTGFKLLRIPN